MDWKKLEGKVVNFMKLRTGEVYTNFKILKYDDTNAPNMIWLTIYDYKYKREIVIFMGEIIQVRLNNDTEGEGAGM